MKRWLVVVMIAMLGRDAGAGNCTCQSKAEIEYRIKEIQALIQGYQAEIARLGANGPQFSTSAYNAFEHGTQQPMLDAMKAANPGSPQTYAGKTEPASCNTSFDPKTPACLLDALKVHEGHHRSICISRKGSYSEVTSPMSDYRDGKPLTEAYQQEIDSFYLELDTLQKAYAALPASCKPDWFLRWEVEITGKSATGAKPTWSVHHVYAGTAKLEDKGMMPAVQSLTPQQIKSMSQAQMIAWAKNMKKLHTWLVVMRQPFVPIEVSIDDALHHKNKSPGEGGSYEKTTIDTTWKGDKVAETVQALFRLEVDEQAHTYNLTIPVEPMGSAKTIQVDETTEVERTAFGFGNLPTHEGPTKTTTMITPATMKIPEVASILVKAQIHHDKDQPFAPKEDVLRFDSGPLDMDAKSTFLQNMPGAATNVKVHVTYTLSRQPL